MVVTMIFSLGFAVGLFFLLPLFLSTFAERATDQRPARQPRSRE